ncbi:shikimate dehydrogenase [Melghiribacillus thermohalophilus]|uniref:Shikimate dehydrogenase (NADP(+)) n=1 Tax=Melghiribacillus thermohalophilus TaxID=1324956 RepID=A0A4R3NDI2_9BACI|nr:shikimate dehydrogenase [Melghiribacillus thermohalophilus]TCT27053.1 shikimate dehydrogenase [Melghiribacillus thermohalophilus]
MGLFFCVIGHPIEHSLSPWIHGQFLNMSGKQGIYRTLDVPEKELGQTLQFLKKLEIDGFNITVPHKERIIKYLDELDPLAEQMGAVNTVVHKEGKWFGYNTDGKGYIRSLQSEYPDLFVDQTDKKALIIGAGGAARGIYFALMDSGFKQIDLANRTVERAHQIKSSNISTDVFSLQEAEEQLGIYDLVIQTTKAGMYPNVHEHPLSPMNVKHRAVVSDIVYRPIETTFLAAARASGARIHFGHGMLLYQAAFSFELWTGIPIDPAPLLTPLEQKLKGE